MSITLSQLDFQGSGKMAALVKLIAFYPVIRLVNIVCEAGSVNLSL